MLQGHSARLMSGAALVALLAAIASPALGQAADDTGEARALEEVVVTGTLIRGVAPVGTNVVGVDDTQIQSMGAISTQQVLSQIPAVTSQFGFTPRTGADIGSNTQKPNIRNLGGSGGNTTLVLVDGHNVVGAGILSTTPDGNILPPGILQRVEVLADGGSSLYGADAVGGIVNFITRRSFEGFEVSGHYGVAKGGYQAGDVNGIAGASWTGGSGYIALSHRENSNLSASKRNYPRQDLTSRGGSDFRVTTCAAPNVTVGATNYAFPSLVAGPRNLCDLAVYSDIVPEERQDSAFAAVTHDLTDRLSLHATAYLSDRKTTVASAQLTATGVTIPQTNPFFIRVAPGASESVAFSFEPVLGAYAIATSKVDQYGFTPTLTYKVGGDWQVAGMFNYGRSKTVVHTPLVNPIALATAAAGTTAATALNPFNLDQTDAGVLRSITNFENYGRNKQTLTEGRVIADGPLFSMPGGEVRVAVGVDYQHQKSDALSVNNAPGNLTGAATKVATRNVTAVFGQIVVPVVGSENALPLVQAFTIDASLRHDDYSDFGGTTNPRVGFTWEVAGGLSLRGNYGTSFNAPSLADTSGAVDSRAQILAVSPFRAPNSPPTDLFRPTIVLAGGNPDLRPQSADTWSIGADWKPSAFEGFQAGITFWKVKLKDAIIVVPPGFPNSLFTVPAFQQFVTINPTLAQAQAITSGMIVDGAPSIAALFTPFSTPYVIIDARRKNIGSLYVSGLDFYANYSHPTDFGSVFASLSGTYTVNRESEAFSGSGRVDLLDANTSRLQLTGTVGATWDSLTASATFNHRRGYDVTGAGSQTHTGSFTPVNLAFVYAVPGEGWSKDLTLTLNVDNVFNEKAPFLNMSPTLAPVNGSTIGRFANLGVRKRF